MTLEVFTTWMRVLIENDSAVLAVSAGDHRFVGGESRSRRQFPMLAVERTANSASVIALQDDADLGVVGAVGPAGHAAGR